MAFYKLFFDREVEKDLSKIPKSDVRRIISKTTMLCNNPKPPNSLKLEGSDMTHRLRVGDYRVIYQIDESSREITVFHIRHRKDVYRHL